MRELSHTNGNGGGGLISFCLGEINYNDIGCVCWQGKLKREEEGSCRWVGQKGGTFSLHPEVDCLSWNSLVEGPCIEPNPLLR